MSKYTFLSAEDKVMHSLIGRHQVGKECLKELKGDEHYCYNHLERWYYSDGTTQDMIVLRSHSCMCGKAWNKQFFRLGEQPEWVNKFL
jgi:uncharacterized protein YchJ